MIEEFEAYRNDAIFLNAIDLGLIHSFQEWLLSVKQYSVNRAGLQLILLKMICKDAERKGVNVNLMPDILNRLPSALRIAYYRHYHSMRLIKLKP